MPLPVFQRIGERAVFYAEGRGQTAGRGYNTDFAVFFFIIHNLQTCKKRKTMAEETATKQEAGIKFCGSVSSGHASNS
jgi:hypothetical protein